MLNEDVKESVAEIPVEQRLPIQVSEKAASEIKRVMDENKMTVDTHALSAGVQGGGCSGFTYNLGFKEKSVIDVLNETVVVQHGISVAVDNRCLSLIQGTLIDFHSGLDRRGFTFINPQATKGCGCGQSFNA